MRIAFYAPLKPPTSPTPSGDRQIARHMITALERAGHTVALASELRTFDGHGDEANQLDLKKKADAEITRFLATCHAMPKHIPDLWLTYHIYHKAPDWIGRIIAANLKIPYVIAEASISPGAANGKWATGHAAAIDCVKAADAVVGLNPRDATCVRPHMKAGARYHSMPPFIDTTAFDDTSRERTAAREQLARSHGIDRDQVWILTVGMMRHGDKFESYRLLSQALDRISDLPWQLLCVGDGDARSQVVELFTRHGPRIAWLGQLTPDRLPRIYAAADFLAWPAIKEALGMVFLEAGAAALPVAAGYTDGVASIVNDRETGLLSPAGDPRALADNLRILITDGDVRKTLGTQAQAHISRNHSVDAASRSLQACLASLEPAHAS